GQCRQRCRQRSRPGRPHPVTQAHPNTGPRTACQSPRMPDQQGRPQRRPADRSHAMQAVHRHRLLLPAILAAATLLPPVALAGTGVNDQIPADMAEARREMRAELAEARLELETGTLELGQDLPFGRKPDKGDAGSPPRAGISPAGDLLIDGQAVAIDARQRRELLAYRGQVIDLALQGIEVGERAAEAAMDAVDQGIFGLLFNAVTGRLERRVERTVRRTVEPGVLRICGQLP